MAFDNEKNVGALRKSWCSLSKMAAPTKPNFCNFFFSKHVFLAPFTWDQVAKCVLHSTELELELEFY